MKKVIVIGCPGAGKSTFSKMLSSITNLPLYHLDMLFWNEDKTHVSREVFDERLLEILCQDSWIIDGNYSRTMEIRLKECDTVFLLDFSTQVCLSGVRSRVGKKRDDIPWIEQEIEDDFKEFIVNFPIKELPNIYELLKNYNNKNIK